MAATLPEVAAEVEAEAAVAAVRHAPGQAGLPREPAPGALAPSG